jgi:hypothetical protein
MRQMCLLRRRVLGRWHLDPDEGAGGTRTRVAAPPGTCSQRHESGTSIGCGERAAFAVASGFDGAAVGADQVSLADGIAARVGLDVLAQDLSQDRGLADVDVAGRGEQGHRAGRG